MSKIGPVGNHVFGDVTLAWNVDLRSAERLPKHILKIISVIGTHPEWEDRHDRRLREQIGVGSSGSNEERKVVFKNYTVQFILEVS